RNATAHMHTLSTKRGIAHALSIGGEVIHRFVWHTATFTWGWGDGGELANRRNQVLDLAMYQQCAGFFGPDAGLLAAGSKDGMGHVPHVLLGMIQVDNLHGSRKV